MAETGSWVDYTKNPAVNVEDVDRNLDTSQTIYPQILVFSTKM